MSLSNLLDSRIRQYRFDSSPTGRLGEPSKTPKLVQSGIRASLDLQRSLLSKDSGPGDRGTGIAIMFVELAFPVELNDVLFIESGANSGSWWVATGFFHQPTRATHREGYVKAYVGALPDDQS